MQCVVGGYSPSLLFPVRRGIPHAAAGAVVVSPVTARPIDVELNPRACGGITFFAIYYFNRVTVAIAVGGSIFLRSARV